MARRRNGYAARGAAVILAIASVVAACADRSPTPSPSQIASQPPGKIASQPPGPAPSSSVVPAITPTPAPTPDESPSEPTADWGPVVLADTTPVANLEPTLSGAGGIATGSAFRLTSLDGSAPADIAARIRVEPSVKLAVARVTGATAILRPAAALHPATLYHFSLMRPDGTIEASWAAQTAGPLHLVESIPGDAATAVPQDTGVELIFDEAGVTTAELGKHLRIDPPTAGRLQVAGRSAVFVPAKPLRRGTLYVVTVTHGLSLAGTDQRLQTDVTIRFETAARTTSRVAVGLQRSFLEATPRERAAMSIWWETPDDVGPPARVPVTVHRLDGLQAAERAWEAVRDAPSWTRVDTRPAVPTGGLQRLLDTRLPIRTSDTGLWIQLPAPLARGWYLVTVSWAGVPRQAVLQITDLATYALVTTTRSSVWVNDVGTGRPVVGASIDLVGRRLGATDATGLVVARTPTAAASVERATARGRVLLEVHHSGRAAFQPIATNHQLCVSCQSGANDDVWQVITSDRYRYRSTDTVNAWGVVRNRDSGAIPASLRVSLFAGSADDGASVAISTQSVTPNAMGAFAVAVPLRALPAGSYRIRVEAGRTSIGELWFDVGTITKPAYQLTIRTDRRAVLSGESVLASVHGSFFEGTPVAGTTIGVQPEEDAGVQATTDSDGDGSARVKLSMEPGGEQWTVRSIEATPTLPEEAEITASTSVAVFRANSLVDVTAAVAGRELTITGKVSAVDFDRVNAAPADGLWSVDPRGVPRAGARVELNIEEHWNVRRQTGSQYDFVLKRVVAVYESDDRSRAIAGPTVTTGADGAFRYRLPVLGGDRSYRIVARHVDAGREVNTETWAASAAGTGEAYEAYLAEQPAGDEERSYGVGDQVRLRFRGGVAKPRVDRYLFAVVQRGLRSVGIQSSPAFRTTFTRADIPGVQVYAVRFTGFGYEETSGYDASFRIADRRLDVRVTADRSHYAPGDTATLTVRTRNTAGRGVPASVFIQAVDEKLFASGDAQVVDPLGALYASVGGGIVATIRSHQTPRDDSDGGGGDTTGGGGDDNARGDFRDWLVGRLVRTGANGTATLDVRLSDDLTSWHVSAEGVDGSLRAGAGELVVPVGLPFFAEATIPATFVVADQPVIRVRAFGGDLRDGEPVTFTIRSATLGMAPVTVSGTAFRAVEVPLAALAVGSHVIRVEASAHGGALKDTLDRPVEVLGSRATRDETAWKPLDGPLQVASGGGFTTVVLVDAGRGRVLPVLQELAGAGGSRCDQLLAAGLARRVLHQAFGLPAQPMDDEALSPFLVQEDDSGLAIVPWGSVNLDVTALAAMSGDPRLPPDTLRSSLWGVAKDADAKRSRRLLALAGLAGLGETVLQDVRAAAAQHGLTVEEQVNVALAAWFAGDEDLARSITDRLLRAHGQHLGPWTRLDAGTREASVVLTARLAIVAASLGEPVAAEMDAWIAHNPPVRTTVVLERAIAARGWAARMSGASARVAVIVDGTRRDLAILSDQAATLTLTPAQAAGARIEPVAGRVLVVTTRSVPLVPTGLTATGGQKVIRTVKPGMRIGQTDTVVVTFRVTLGPDARDECWLLTDVVPSGLAPISGYRMDEDGKAVGPTSVDGQRVEFCLERDPHRAVQEVRYVARVVDPGRYAWEPAVLQSSIVPEQGIATPAGTLEIGGSGGA